jgi:UDP-N-acetylglucosamine--N-acetylmuramyl-(pentapeptide) pyrophosphoryl-undecaprenol N-acetylglucosamine transferase
MGNFYRLADLYVGRGGALTIYELGLNRTPAIIIPIPWVTHNEQYNNALALQNLGLAEILPEGELSSDVLFQKIGRTLGKIKTGQRRYDEKKLKQVFVTDAAQKIVDILVQELNL